MGGVLTRQLLRLAVVAIVAGAVGPVGAAADDGAKRPAAVTGSAGDVTATSAVLTGAVTAEARRATYAFEYGATTASGTSTTPLALDARTGHARDATVPVSVAVTGLLPSTTYHFRLVAMVHRHTLTGEDATFTTAGAAPLGAAPIVPAVASAPAAPTPSAPAATPPALGASVVVTPVAGVVTVRPGAAAAPVALGAAATLPVGTLIDTRRGTARLVTAVDRSGRTQSVLLREGLVEVRQAARRGGLTELRLRGADFSRCGRGAARAAAVARRRPPRRTLWARDTGGRFRTRGRNSVATVRGTTWRTTDTCRGTTTSVAGGSVVVRDVRTGRRFVVRAGERHLARSAR
jgi:hypothetical protein